VLFCLSVSSEKKAAPTGRIVVNVDDDDEDDNEYEDDEDDDDAEEDDENDDDEDDDDCVPEGRRLDRLGWLDHLGSASALSKNLAVPYVDGPEEVKVEGKSTPTWIGTNDRRWKQLEHLSRTTTEPVGYIAEHRGRYGAQHLLRLLHRNVREDRELYDFGSDHHPETSWSLSAVGKIRPASPWLSKQIPPGVREYRGHDKPPPCLYYSCVSSLTRVRSALP
jgi:hypothetical protein